MPLLHHIFTATGIRNRILLFLSLVLAGLLLAVIYDCTTDTMLQLLLLTRIDIPKRRRVQHGGGVMCCCSITACYWSNCLKDHRPERYLWQVMCPSWLHQAKGLATTSSIGHKEDGLIYTLPLYPHSWCLQPVQTMKKYLPQRSKEKK